MKTRLILLGVALTMVAGIPLIASAREEQRRSFRVRDDRGENRVIISRDNGRIVLDDEDLEALFANLDAIGPEIEEAIQEAMEGLEDLDFDFDFDFDPDDHFFVGGWDNDWDDEEWEDWSDHFSERMEGLSERINERVRRAVRDDSRFRSRWNRFDRDDRYDDERDELQDQVRELQREIRRLTKELDDLRGEG